ncbi:MAG: hypothetical protein ACXWU1_12500 [Allosphingosinicella sp.]
MRWVALVACAFAAIWFGFLQNDWLDRRPVQRVLFLGDSYTYYNDMPAMVTEMADSAGSENRIAITMRAFPSATLEDHWNNSETRSLLAQGGWDRIVVQPESYLQMLDAGSEHYRFGSRLLNGTGVARPAIVVSWTASNAHYESKPVTRAEHFRNLERNSRGLAARTGGELIDVAQVWEDLLADDLPFSLYKDDGNHPSLEGSYAAALVVYASLSGRNVADVAYVPWSMNGEHATLLRDRVQESLRARGMAGFSATAGHAQVAAN